MLSLALRLALCVAATYFGWKFLGAVGLVLSAPVWGMAFTKPVARGLGKLYHLMRVAMYRSVQGHNYSYKGQSLAIVKDEDNCRWLRASDVRKVIEHFPRDESLLELFGEHAETRGEAPGVWIQAQALHSYLARSTTSQSIRFKVWLHGEVIFPSGAGRR